MKSSSSFYVFTKWKEAPPYAFGSKTKTSIVPAEDKVAYKAIYDELMSAASSARVGSGVADHLTLKPMSFSAEYGSRGHRPVDLWVSICAVNSEKFGQMPQIYAIASDRGLEVGFAVSIDEDDYYDPAVKARNQTVVPLLNAKLPEANDQSVERLDEVLVQQGGWHFNAKTRLSRGQSGFERYTSLRAMLTALKATTTTTGGGTICRTFTDAELNNVNLEAEFTLALQNFLSLIAICAPSPWDVEIITIQDDVSTLAEDSQFDPANAEDARKRVLRAVAQRQGQQSFRRSLIAAYQGRCAISGTAVLDVLEAAHITPYLGPDTNDVTNGLLLRADIHTLFDLRLIRIHPQTLQVELSPNLKGSPYMVYAGKTLARPSSPNQNPSRRALEHQYGPT